MFFHYFYFDSCLSYLCIVLIIKCYHMTKYIMKIRSCLAHTSQSQHLEISIYKFLQSFLVILSIISFFFFHNVLNYQRPIQHLSMNYLASRRRKRYHGSRRKRERFFFKKCVVLCVKYSKSKEKCFSTPKPVSCSPLYLQCITLPDSQQLLDKCLLN